MRYWTTPFLRHRRTLRLSGVAVCLVLVACNLGLPGRVVEPSLAGVITEMEQVPGDDDRVVTVNGAQLRILDPGLRRIAGPSLGADRLLIYWETDDGPYFAVSVEEPAGCYTLRSAAAFDVGGAIVFVWSEQPELGIRLMKEAGVETRIDDPETGALRLPIEVCLDESGVVTESF